MRAFVLDSFEAAPRVRDDMPVPEIGERDVLVRVHASSVNPVDAFTAMGALKGMLEYRFPVVLGRDLAGVVERTGAGVSRYGVGDEVFGWLGGQVLHAGTWAEYVALPEEQFTARKPAGAGFAEAGAAPLAGGTALFALEALELAAGDTVLVVGATGGVGSFVVQLAADRGAHVIATGLPEDEDFLRDLGAAERVDRDSEVAAAVRERNPGGIDALVDLVNRDPAAFAENAALVRPGGRAASVLGAAGDGVPEGVAPVNVMNMPDPAKLDELARLVGSGTLRVPIQRSYPLEQTADAIADLQTRHTQGKIAISIG